MTTSVTSPKPRTVAPPMVRRLPFPEHPADCILNNPNSYHLFAVSLRCANCGSTDLEYRSGQDVAAMTASEAAASPERWRPERCAACHSRSILKERDPDGDLLFHRHQRDGAHTGRLVARPLVHDDALDQYVIPCRKAAKAKIAVAV